MRIADTAFGLVLVLTAGTAAAERVAPQIVLLDLDLDSSFNFGHHVHGRERRLSSSVRIKRTDTHQPVYACLALQATVSEIALDVQRGAANAGFVVAQLVNELCLIAVA